MRRPREAIAPYVEHLTAELGGANPEVRFVWAGSWRRGSPVCGDLDLLVVTPTGSLSGDLMQPGVHFPACISWDRLGDRIGNGYVHTTTASRSTSTCGESPPSSSPAS